MGVFWEPLVEMMATADPGSINHIDCVATAEQAVKQLKIRFES